MPHFDYCSPLWDCLSVYVSNKLQELQNRAARVITKSPFDTSANHLLSTLDWERLFLRRKKQKALIMYKTMNYLAPEYLQSLSASLCLQLKKLGGKADHVQTKHQFTGRNNVFPYFVNSTESCLYPSRFRAAETW